MPKWIDRRTYSLLFVALSLALLAGSWPSASAGSLTQNMGVSATVIGACTAVTPNILSFGNYTQGGSQVNGNTTISVTCGNGISYTLDADRGLYWGGTLGGRNMQSGLNWLGYGLCKDAACTNAWGTTAGGTAISGTGTGSAQTITVYGWIPGAQTVPPGSYADAVVVTLAW